MAYLISNSDSSGVVVSKIFVKKGETSGVTAQRFQVTGTHQKMGVPWVSYRLLARLEEDGFYRLNSERTYSCPSSQFSANTQPA
jgi:hypothetical protein